MRFPARMVPRPWLFYVKRTTGVERKRGDCLSAASCSPFSGTMEESRKRDTALIFSLVLSFVSRQKKRT